MPGLFFWGGPRNQGSLPMWGGGGLGALGSFFWGGGCPRHLGFLPMWGGSWMPGFPPLDPCSFAGEFTTAEGLEYEVVELPYARGGLSLLLAVPLVRDAPLAPLARTLSASLIRAWTRGLSPRPRLLLLPRSGGFRGLDAWVLWGGRGLSGDSRGARMPGFSVGEHSRGWEQGV